MDGSEDQRPSKKPKIMHSQTHAGKRHKQAGKWKAQRAKANGKVVISTSGIHNDDKGIFVTCSMGQENKCLREMNDLLSQYIGEAAGISMNGPAAVKEGTDISDTEDVESSIQRELESMKPSTSSLAFTFVKLDIPCVSFVKTGDGIDPVSLVHTICKDAHSKSDQKRSRFIKRMTPMTLMRKTMGGGLEHVSQSVLRPHFHAGGPAKKYAIRPTIRHNDALSRDEVIKTVAAAVGSEHTVDLKNYDLLILVEVYRNVCGMSVVGNDFEELKKFNLAEIYQPTTRPIPNTMAAATRDQRCLSSDMTRSEVPPKKGFATE